MNQSDPVFRVHLSGESHSTELDYFAGELGAAAPSLGILARRQRWAVSAGIDTAHARST